MKLLDTNVIMYARGKEHPLKAASEAVLRLYSSGAVDCNINVEVLQEILHSFQARGQITVGREVLQDAVAAFPDPLQVTREDVLRAAELLVRYPSLQARDAVHAAVVFQHRLEGIISTDRGFDIIDGLTRFDPKELAV